MVKNQENINIYFYYGSTTGNSEEVAYYLNQYLSKHYQTTSQLINVNTLEKNYSFDDNPANVYILCTSTWGIDPPVLQEDFDEFWHHKLHKSSIKQQKFALFALGDKEYPFFAYAGNILTHDILQHDGKLLLESLKIEDPWYLHKTLITEHLKQIVEQIHHTN